MEITKDQVQQLFAFTEKKFVRYYDLQVELVDHLAERIEEKMKADASIDFEKALESVYKDFGIFGFSKIVQEKSEQLRKQNNKRLYNEIKNVFQWPEAIFSFVLGLFVWTIISNTDKIIMNVLFSLYLLASTVIIIWNWKKFKPIKKLMVTENMPDQFGFFPFIFHSLFFDDYNLYSYAFFIFSTVIFQVASFRIGKKLRQEAQTNYPAAFA